MSELNNKVKAIINCVNDETAGMDYNDRAMVLLLVMEFIKCAVELDILDTLRSRKAKTCEMEINTGMTAIRCSACGYELPKGTDLKSTRFCGGCGAKVVDA